MNRITSNLKEIREYTRSNPELIKSHHFLYDCLIKKNTEGVDVIIIGVNPGETKDDWAYGHDLPTEESSEFDFHEACGRSRSSVTWSMRAQEYLKTTNVVLAEFFFWSAPQSGEDSKKGILFSERYGYRFKRCPHFDFCRAKNIDLINYYNPKLIVAPGVAYSDFFAEIYGLDYKRTLKCPASKTNRRAVVHYEFQGIPFIFTLHWTGAQVSNAEKTFIADYLSNFLI